MRFIPAILFAGLIFWVSSQTRLPQAPFLFEGIDKVFHAGEYGVLTALVLFGARWPDARRAWAWVLPVVVYAASDELHQLFVPGRSADLLDWLADSAGALLVTACWLKLRARPLGRPIVGRVGVPS
jgi:VanZ family protein